MRTIGAPFFPSFCIFPPLFFLKGVFHIDLEFEERLWKSDANSNQSLVHQPWWSFDTPFEVLQANAAQSAFWTRLS